jgi:hypothetical protein
MFGEFGVLGCKSRSAAGLFLTTEYTKEARRTRRGYR